MTEDNIVDFTGYTTLDIDPKKMLEGIVEECNYSKVILMGLSEDDGDWHFHNSVADKATIVYVAELCKLATIAE
jgi:hypothetical protein